MYRIIYKVRDAKGMTSSFTLHVIQGSFNNVYEYAQLMLELFQAIMYGQIYKTELIIPIEPITSPPQAVDALADVQEGLWLAFATDNGDHALSMTIPAIDESAVGVGNHRESMDITQPRVAALYTALIDGLIVNSEHIWNTDVRGAQPFEQKGEKVIFRAR